MPYTSSKECGSPESATWYLCHAETGYDGPDGEGTPNKVLSFTGVPFVIAEAATGIAKKEVTLNGTVNPGGLATKYYFKYGASITYGLTTPEAPIAAGTANEKESKVVMSLTPETTYHYKMVATNSAGTTEGEDQTVRTLPEAPANTVLPVLSPSTPDQDVPESTTTGTWTHSPTSYTYQWKRCNATGGECANISGATSSTYTPGELDVGKTLKVTVTAKNSGGSGSAESVASGKVKPIGEITEYALPAESSPWGITQGPDGNLWYTNQTKSKIGKITTSGTITEYALPAGSSPRGITQGPDGNLWFVNYATNKIGKITVAGTITEFGLPEGASEPSAIAEGPDGNVWFTAGERVGKITPSGSITVYFIPLPGFPHAYGIATGPGGEIWYTAEKPGHPSLIQMTTTGTITNNYAVPSWVSRSENLMLGPDGDLWLTVNEEEGVGKIAKFTASGWLTEYALPAGSIAAGIVGGPEGNLWFADQGTSKVGKITTSGTITEYALPKGSGPLGITEGPDRNLWYTDYASFKIGKIVP